MNERIQRYSVWVRYSLLDGTHAFNQATIVASSKKEALLSFVKDIERKRGEPIAVSRYKVEVKSPKEVLNE